MGAKFFGGKSLTLSRVREVLDYDPLTGIFTWRVRTSNRVQVGDQAGVVSDNGYIFLLVDNDKVLAHRLAWFYVYGVWPKNQIDHIDRNRASNALANLREATMSENAANGVLRSNNKSGYRGVSWDKRRSKWVARIVKEYKQHVLGYFVSKEDAYAAYLSAAREKQGAFAAEHSDHSSSPPGGK